MATGLDELVEELKAQKKAMDDEKDLSELGKKIDELNKNSSEASLKLKEAFDNVVAELENPQLGEEERAIAEQTLETIREGTQTEENLREARNLQLDANNILLNIASGIDSLASSFDKFMSDALKKGSLLGALGAIGMLLFDPETLKKWIDSVILFFSDMYDMISYLIVGDWEAAWEIAKENLTGIGIAIGLFFAKFGGGIIRAVASLVRIVKTGVDGLIIGGKGIASFFSGFADSIGESKLGKWFTSIGEKLKPFTDGVKNIATKVKTFIEPITSKFSTFGKWLSDMGKYFGEFLNLFKSSATANPGMFSKIMGIFGKILGKLALPLTIALSIWEAIKGAMSGFSEGGIVGGIKGALVGIFDGLVGGLLDMLKDGLSWILDALGFENAAAALDSFSFTDSFSGLVDTIFTFIGDLSSWFMDKFSYLSDVIMDTLFAPIDFVVNWFMETFGFEVPEGGFSLREEIGKVVDKISDFFVGLLSSIPDMVSSLLSDIPGIGGFFSNDDSSSNVSMLEDAIKNDPSRKANLSDDEIKAIAAERATGFFGGIDEEEAQAEMNSLIAERQQARQLISSGANKDEVNSLLSSGGLSATPPSGEILDQQRNLQAAAAATPPTVIALSTGGGGGGNRSSVNNVSTSSSTYNISSGVSADDFVRREFVNAYG